MERKGGLGPPRGSIPHDLTRLVLNNATFRGPTDIHSASYACEPVWPLQFASQTANGLAKQARVVDASVRATSHQEGVRPEKPRQAYRCRK